MLGVIMKGWICETSVQKSSYSSKMKFVSPCVFDTNEYEVICELHQFKQIFTHNIYLL